MNERIKEVRKSYGLSQEEFGRRIGVTKSSVSLLEKENGNNPSEQTIRAICSEFRISRAWLIDGIGEMKLEPETPDELVDEKLANGSKFTKALMHVLARMSDDELVAVEHLFIELHKELDDK